MRGFITFGLFWLGAELAYGQNQKITSFYQAKKELKKIYESFNKPLTFYCGCPLLKKSFDPKPCGYQPKSPLTKKGKKNQRTTRIEWEHVVPAHAFGQAFKEWRERDQYPACKKLSNRGCARKLSPLFEKMESDLYNLVPSIGEINGDRSNKSMAELPGEPREYGACDVEISKDKIEPRAEVRGDVARIYFYMEQAYPGKGIVSNKNKKLFQAWDRLDPVDEFEKERAQKIFSVQGNCNGFVLDCKDQKPPVVQVKAVK